MCEKEGNIRENWSADRQNEDSRQGMETGHGERARRTDWRRLVGSCGKRWRRQTAELNGVCGVRCSNGRIWYDGMDWRGCMMQSERKNAEMGQAQALTRWLRREGGRFEEYVSGGEKEAFMFFFVD